jgi:hypothetical protein
MISLTIYLHILTRCVCIVVSMCACVRASVRAFMRSRMSVVNNIEKKYINFITFDIKKSLFNTLRYAIIYLCLIPEGAAGISQFHQDNHTLP